MPPVTPTHRNNYNPRTSTWLSVDPLAEKTMTPYQYCNQSPVMQVDPTGMEAQGPDDWYWDPENKRFVYIEGETQSLIAYAIHEEGATSAPEIKHLYHVGKSSDHVLKTIGIAKSNKDSNKGFDVVIKNASDRSGKGIPLPITHHLGELHADIQSNVHIELVDESLGGVTITGVIQEIIQTYKVKMFVNKKYADIFSTAAVSIDIERYNSEKDKLSSANYELTFRDQRKYNEFRPSAEGYQLYQFYPQSFSYKVSDLQKNIHRAVIKAHVANPIKGGGGFNTITFKF